MARDVDLVDDGASDDGHALDGGLPVPAQRIDDLRRARRRRRVAEVHWVDALYRAYLAGIAGAIAVAVIAGAVGGDPLTDAQVDHVARRGPALIGLAALVVLAVGLRSGSRGGPLALERADVRHVMLAPVDRGRALRRPAVRQVRSATFVAVLTGAVIGRFAANRFPQPAAEWVLAGAAALATVVAAGYGAALVAGGVRLPRWAATGIGAVLVGWGALDAFRVDVGGSPIPASPGRAVGWLALAPIQPHWASVGAVLVAVALLAVGLAVVGGVSLEAAERRTALVGQIRFAATLQDIRTVMVLRRQLGADRPRRRPWIPLPRALPGRPGWWRAVRGLLRFPVVRVLRVAVLAAVGGVALRVAWSGTTPAIVVTGLALWLAGLDLVEPMAEEVDHPGRTDLYPTRQGSLLIDLLSPSLLVALPLGAVTAGVAVAPGAGQVPTALGFAVGVGAALTAVAGAASSVFSSTPSHDSTLSLMAPEVAGMGTVLKAVWPPFVAVLGAAPLLIAVANDRADRPLMDGTSTAWMAVAAVAAIALGWIHQRQEIMDWWRDAMDANAQLRSLPDRDDPDDPDEGDR
ncbi:MAG: hypothetical protein GXY13_15885 [Acidimicrobiales bacterium]|nr:hypothetical protein [Acidimicrobiales bacterium]